MIQFIKVGYKVAVYGAILTGLITVIQLLIRTLI